MKHYLALFSILAFAVLFFFHLSYNRQAQEGVIIATAAAYVLWGVVHHMLEKDFHWRILLEYIVVAMMASVVVIFLLMRT